jgi:hypothetical protein
MANPTLPQIHSNNNATQVCWYTRQQNRATSGRYGKSRVVFNFLCILPRVGRDREVRTILPVPQVLKLFSLPERLRRLSGRPSSGAAVPRVGIGGSSLDVAGEESKPEETKSWFCSCERMINGLLTPDNSPYPPRGRNRRRR